jgi:hypothetical protein
VETIVLIGNSAKSEHLSRLKLKQRIAHLTTGKWAIPYAKLSEGVLLMGFLSSLFNGMTSLAEQQANRIDRMSDDDIEKRYVSKNPDKSVGDYRDLANKAHELSSRRKKDDD